MKQQHCPITGAEAHRVLIQFLLEEARKQYTLISPHTSFEEDVLDRIIAENEKHLPIERVNTERVKGWRRRCRFAIESAGLNHYDLAQVLSGRVQEYDLVAFHERLKEVSPLI